VDATELARRFGLDGAATLSAGPVARGKQGEVWQLRTPDGRWAVKVPFQPVDEDDVRDSTLFQEAAYALGVPTPLVRRADDGRVLATVTGRQVRLYGWVDLRPPDPLLDPALVGSVVGAMHQVPSSAAGEVAAWDRAPVGAARWDELVRLLRDAGAPFAGRLADLRDELVALESWLEPPRDVRLCHCDLWADNVLPTAVGGVCVLDWENSGPADPSQELGCVLFEFGRTDAGRARALVQAYRDAGGPGSVERRGRFSMLIAQLGHITEIAATDWLQPNPRSPDRAAAAAWISEVFDDPHTRAVLDELLRWVT
jgi:Ser/Thr protein kinase RdoA (MazF antagonist)